MDRMRSSSIREYVGIVAEDKKPEERIVKVYVEELLPFLEGNLSAEEVPDSVNMKDKLIQQYSGQPNMTNYISCEYRDMFSNRQDPPDVVRGEQVTVYQLADSKQYYWYSTGRNDNLRKNEHMRMAISSTPEVGTERTDDNTYVIEFDSRKDKKKILIKTSKADEESFAYTVQLDVSQGIVHICDDANNELFIDSAEKIVRLRNTDGCTVNLDKKNIAIVAVDDLVLKAGKQIVTDSRTATFNTLEGSGVMVFNSKACTHNSSSSFSITSPVNSINGNTIMPDRVVTGPHRAEGYSTGKIVARRNTKAGSSKDFKDPS